MVWLGLEFNSVVMTITIPQPKLAEIADLVAEWTTMSHATLHQLRVLLCKLPVLCARQVFPQQDAGHPQIMESLDSSFSSSGFQAWHHSQPLAPGKLIHKV